MNIHVYNKNQHDGESWKEDIRKRFGVNRVMMVFFPDKEDVYDLTHGPRRADVIVTIRKTLERCDFEFLRRLPCYLRRRWIHVSDSDSLTVRMVETVMDNILRHPEKMLPTVSVFTSTFHSGEKIMRPFESLVNQTFQEWEWVILDDSSHSSSTGGESADETWTRLSELARRDCRIHIYHGQDGDGYIGSVKKKAAGLCRGRYLVELDHDDDLVPTALEKIVQAFERYPEAGMVVSDCTEWYEDTGKTHCYGEYFGMNFGVYIKQWFRDRWINVIPSIPSNRWTLRHIVGVPNHVRVWRKTVYDMIGGHNPSLNVADDYDLILRTFLVSRIVRIPEMLYVQYRNMNGNNFTFHRNALIQDLVARVERIHGQEISQRLVELGCDGWRVGEKSRPYPHPPYHDSQYIPRADLVYDPSYDTRISIVMTVSRGCRPESFVSSVRSVINQDDHDWVLYIIGYKNPWFERMMDTNPLFHTTRIQWWNLDSVNDDDGATGVNYALMSLITTRWVAYLKEGVVWEKDHLSQCRHSFTGQEKHVGFVFSSVKDEKTQQTIFLTDPQQDRIGFSTVCHDSSLLKKYGFLQKRKDGGDMNEWELISRWIEGGESWVSTGCPTVITMKKN